MEQWLNILNEVLRRGVVRPDRTGVGTKAVFGEVLKFDNSKTFPAVTTKKLAFRQVVAELACFVRGYQTLEEFHSLGCTIWDGNGVADYWVPRARCPGDLGRIYGVQWRDWRTVSQAGGVSTTDQLSNLIVTLRKDPCGRRHIVTALNPGEVDQMCLPPCHLFFQAFVRGTRLDLCVYMRSVDLFLGLPFDIASYAVLQRLIAKETGLDSGTLTFFLGDAHIYLNHLDQVGTVLAREVLEAPQLDIHPDAGLFTFEPAQVTLRGYISHPAVYAQLNV